MGAFISFVVACSCSAAERRLPGGAGSDASHAAATSTSVVSATSMPESSATSMPASSGRDDAASARKPGAGVASGLRELAVSGFENAVIVNPPGDRALPLLVATHGAGGDPTWECERWARVARARWFLACPRGTELRRGQPGSYFYPDHPTLEREVTAVVEAVRSTYGSRVTQADGVYLGYSQGATMGALMVVEHGALFPHLLLIEGGSGDWTLKRAARFHETGGRSVFIVCGTEPCDERATASAQVLERAGVHAVTSYAEAAGHTELGAVGERAEALLETLANSPK